MKTLFNYNSCAFIAGAQYIEGFPKSPYPELAFIGRSNVGKSSLINAMLATNKMARTSSKAGCTKQINFFLLANKIMLVDMPGYGYARVSKAESQRINNLIFDYFENRTQLYLTFILIDARRGVLDMDRTLMQFFTQKGLLFAIIVTKVDKISENEMTELQIELEKIIGYSASSTGNIFYTNAIKNVGILALKNFIAHLKFK